MSAEPVANAASPARKLMREEPAIAQKYRDVGVTTLSLRIEGKTVADRISLLEQAGDLLRGL
jgi:hypothetical protein